ncbi:MAG: hypothetical protein BA867_05025 [Desulfobacterales bacterium S5133MH16]|nr:MAG: hypothetical protein BA867_05025 [Desulfobacterales bacterium S5133MH16]
MSVVPAAAKPYPCLGSGARANTFESQYRENAPQWRVSLSNRLKLVRDLCKTPPFAQFQRQAQILILKILNVFLWLKFSPFLVLNKIEHFSKVSVLKHP